MSQLKNQNVIIVGASSGIGRALAESCLEAGASVRMVSRSLEKLQRASAEYTGDFSLHSMDMLDASSVASTFADFGAFDHLVITAVADETKLFAPIQKMELETARRGMQKFWGAFHCCQAAAERISKSGSITLTSSVAIYRPSNNGAAVMTAASGAVAAFGKALAVELAPIRVNIIAPGVVETGVWDAEQAQGLRSWAEEQLPVRHLGQAPELAQAYHALMINDYITGSVLTVDGGLSLV